MTPLRLVLIIRTSKRKLEARSPKQQRDMAESCARANGYEIVAVLDSERDESGKTMDRASVHTAMAMIRDRQADGIIVGLLDRIGRSPIEEVMAWLRELDKIGGVLVPADAGGRPVDIRDPQAQTNLVIQLQMAHQYWLAASARFKHSQRDAIRDGKFIGKTPDGYVRHRGRLYPDEDGLAPVVSEAFLLADGKGIHAVIDHLRAHVPGRRWDTDSVRRLLRSRAYLGESSVVHKDVIDPKDESKWQRLVNTQAHRPLVTESEWEAAQTQAGPRRTNGEYVLSQVATCGECGAYLVGALQSIPGRGRTYRRYRCSACTRCSISATKLEGYVRDGIRAHLRRPRALEVRDVGDELIVAESEVRQARAERKALTRKVKPSHPDFGTWVADLDEAVAAAEGRRKVAARAAAEVERIPADVTSDEDLLAAIRGLRARIVVAPGRGDVDARVDVDNLDDRSGALAA